MLPHGEAYTRGMGKQGESVDAMTPIDLDRYSDIEDILESVRNMVRGGRVTRVGQWRSLHILVDGQPADMLIELAVSALYMRGELYVHETPEGAYLRMVHDG